MSPKEVVQDMFHAFAQGDIARLLNHCSPDCEWIVPGSNTLPGAGRYAGKQEIGHFFARVSESFTIHSFEVREFIAEHDRVAVIGRTTLGLPGTPAPVTSDWTMLFSFAGDKVVRFEDFYDAARIEQAFNDSLAAVA